MEISRTIYMQRARHTGTWWAYANHECLTSLPCARAMHGSHVMSYFVVLDYTSTGMVIISIVQSSLNCAIAQLRIAYA